ncbi:MAG: FtsH protease activity modulator HflK [Ruminococcaceae bacterium]|nr:FtsH protease activity modulator HflK [Oscillospiraceae bacterium]
MNYEFRPKPPKKSVSPKAVGRAVVIAAVILVIFSVLGTCWYTVDEKQQAVITTFGKVTGTAGAGMHFKLPFGIQQVDKVNVNVYQKIEIGYRSNGSDSTSVEKESKMITGDYNIVNVDFFVEYKVSDPVKYLYSSAEPELILKNLVQSQIRNVIGSATVDSVLTDGKAEIQQKVKELITAELMEYDIGLALTDIKIQDSEPPTTSVIEAFKNVETAKQAAETLINQAKAYQNSELPKAEASADQLIRNAEYLKQKRINDAAQQVAMFEAMYSQYAKNPDITRVRMYYEALTEALPGVKLYINIAESGSTDMLLPLESFANNGGTK